MTKNLTYSEKLKDPRWQKKRLEVFQRDQFKCTLCNDNKTTLHVHHLEYIGNPWDISAEKLITVCEHCHSIIEYFKKNGKTVRQLTKFGSNEAFYIIVLIRTIEDEGYTYIGRIQYGEFALQCCMEENGILNFLKS